MRLGLALLSMMSSVLFFALDAQTARAEEERVITFPITDFEIDDVLACAQSPSDSCRKCTDPSANSVSLMNYSLLREALRAGGIKARVQPVPSPNSERSRAMIKSGLADIKTDWAFNIDVNRNVLQTIPIIRVGELEKGLYGRRHLVDLYANASLGDIRKLRAVSLRNWRLDWQVLESLSPASLTNVATRQQLFSLIKIGRADFTLIEFSSSEGMAREINGIELFPIAGVKVSLAGSQHFMVSRTLKNADQVVEGLNRGIEILREKGFIRRCLINSGIINPKVKDWHTLGQDTAAPKNRTAPSN